MLGGMKDEQLSIALQLKDNVTVYDIKSAMRSKEVTLQNQKSEIEGVGAMMVNVAAMSMTGQESHVRQLSTDRSSTRPRTDITRTSHTLTRAVDV